MHHAPSTGDVPNTVFTQAHAGLMITPVNYLLGSPAKQTRHMARVSFTEDGVKEVKKFGVVAPSCDISAASLEADLSTYMGDQTIRKFPYDFRGWYEENAN